MLDPKQHLAVQHQHASDMCTEPKCAISATRALQLVKSYVGFFLGRRPTRPTVILIQNYSTTQSTSSAIKYERLCPVTGAVCHLGSATIPMTDARLTPLINI